MDSELPVSASSRKSDDICICGIFHKLGVSNEYCTIEASVVHFREDVFCGFA